MLRDRDEQPLAARAEAWRQWVRDDPGPSVPNEFVVGYLSRAVVDCLARGAGRDGGKITMPTKNGKALVFDRNSTTIATTRRDFGHLTRGGAKGTRPRLTEEEIDRIPAILESPDAVLWDNDEKSLLYLFNLKEKYRGKLVVRIQHLEMVAADKGKITHNRLRTAGYISATDIIGKIKSGAFALLDGVGK